VSDIFNWIPVAGVQGPSPINQMPLYGGGSFGAQTDAYSAAGAAYGRATGGFGGGGNGDPYGGGDFIGGAYPTGNVERGADLPDLSQPTNYGGQPQAQIPNAYPQLGNGGSWMPNAGGGDAAAEMLRQMNQYNQTGSWGDPGSSDTFSDRWSNVPPVNSYLQPTGGGLPPEITTGVNPSPQLPAMSTSFESRWNALPGTGGEAAPQSRSDPAAEMLRQMEKYNRTGSWDDANASMGGVPTPQSRPPAADMYYDPTSFNSRFPTDSGGATQSQADAYRDSIAREMMRLNGAQESATNGSQFGTPFSGQVGPQGDAFTSYPYMDMNATRQIANRFPWDASGSIDPAALEQQRGAGINDLQRLLEEIDRGTANQDLSRAGPDPYAAFNANTGQGGGG